jgi:hypothetical protein
MKSHIENLTNRLFYIPETKKEQPSLNKSQKPEDDPYWPKEVKTMADIVRRNEIKDKYKP